MFSVLSIEFSSAFSTNRKGGAIIILGKRYEAFNLKSRCAALGITLDELRVAANNATGLKKYPSDFTRARNGSDSSDSAKRIIAAADRILTELELQEKERRNTENAKGDN